MSKTVVSFSVTDQEFVILQAKAMSKGLTPSQFVKMAVFDHINQHPPKGVMAQVSSLRRRERRSDGAGGNSEEVSE